MQTAGHRITAAAELAAGVQLRHDGLDAGLAFAGHFVDRNAPAVVDHANAVVGQDRHTRPAPRQPSCRRSHRPGGAGLADRWNRCTCQGECARPQALRARAGRSRRNARETGCRPTVRRSGPCRWLQGSDRSDRCSPTQATPLRNRLVDLPQRFLSVNALRRVLTQAICPVTRIKRPCGRSTTLLRILLAWGDSCS